MNEFEQKGYNDWIEIWCRNNCSPSASECPARYMEEGEERSNYIRGWNKAKKENEGIFK